MATPATHAAGGEPDGVRGGQVGRDQFGRLLVVMTALLPQIRDEFTQDGTELGPDRGVQYVGVERSQGLVEQGPVGGVLHRRARGDVGGSSAATTPARRTSSRTPRAGWGTR